MEPDVLRQSGGFQLSYNLPHRNFDTCLYSLPSPNGSSIIIYGHDEGIRIVWYGGTYTEPENTVTSSQNQHNINIVQNTSVYDATLRNEPDFDPSEAYHRIIAYKDIPLGSSALRIAQPANPTGPSQPVDGANVTFFNSHIVVAVACADLSLNAIICPLHLPTSEWNREVKILNIGGADTHQELVSALAVTWQPDLTKFEEEDENKPRSRSRSQTRDASTQDSSGSHDQWSLLLTSVSPTGKGLLMIHRLLLGNDDSGSPEFKDYVLLQRQYISGSLLRCSMEFNPSIYPSERHSKLLITFPEMGCVKIFDLSPPTLQTKRRRGSAATTESAGSSSQTQRPSGEAVARCCISLYTGFATEHSATSIPHRKTILDAAWIMQGRSILVLLGDGEWGIWDIESAGPLPPTSSQRLLRDQSNTTGLVGGALTKFAIRGKIVPLNSVQSSLTQDEPKGTSRGSSLTPMTPHTRKTRSNGFFKGSSDNSTTASSKSLHVKGSITTRATQNENTPVEEAVVLTFGGVNLFIPSIQMLWRSEIGNGRSSGTSSGRQQINLPQLQLGGETNERALLLLLQTHRGDGLYFGGSDLSPPFLVPTISRLIIHTTPLTEDDIVKKPSSTLPVRALMRRPVEVDQALLRQGELDVDGMDRILESMEQGNQNNRAAIPPSRKSVGFSLENGDGDVEMTTPTLPRSSKPFSINRRANAGRQNLFT